jgi:hypothetical protein
MNIAIINMERDSKHTPQDIAQKKTENVSIDNIKQ